MNVSFKHVQSIQIEKIGSAYIYIHIWMCQLNMLVRWSIQIEKIGSAYIYKHISYIHSVGGSI